MFPTRNLNSSNAVITEYDYTYDDAGNRTHVVDQDSDRVTWTYDRSYQVLSEDSSAGSYRHTFTYDDAGNRLTRDDGTAVTTWTYDTANRMETADDGSGVTTYTFDATGNQELIEAPSGDLTTYAWTFENQMSRIERPDATLVTYTWAPVTRRSDEFRISRETDSDTVNFLWDAENILRETDDVGTVEAQYTFSPQPHPEPYSALISQRRDTESSFYHFDGLGSTRALTDTSETETDSYAFQAFGEVASSSGTTENRFAWVGQKGYYNDSESGLYSLRRRDYGSGQGRFVSEDPLGRAVEPGHQSGRAAHHVGVHRRPEADAGEPAGSGRGQNRQD